MESVVTIIDQTLKEYSHDAYAIAGALINTLSDEELLNETIQHEFKKIYLTVVRHRKLERRLAIRLHNRMKKYIVELESQECKRKVYLRKTLINMFEFVSKNDKKTILFLMLTQTKNERIWACRAIKRNWDPSFEKSIVETFVKFSEEEAAKVIMYHCQPSRIYQLRESLSMCVNPSWIIRRLWEDFPDMRRLKQLPKAEFVRTVLALNLDEYKEELESILYRQIAAEVAYMLTRGLDNRLEDRLFDGAENNESNRIRLEQYFDIYNTQKLDSSWGYSSVIAPSQFILYYFRHARSRNFIAKDFWSLFSFRGVDLLIWAMGRMGLTDAILRFQVLNRKLTAKCPSEVERIVAEYLIDWLQIVYKHVNVDVFHEPPLSKNFIQEVTLRPVDIIYDNKEDNDIQTDYRLEGDVDALPF